MDATMSKQRDSKLAAWLIESLLLASYIETMLCKVDTELVFLLNMVVCDDNFEHTKEDRIYWSKEKKYTGRTL